LIIELVEQFWLSCNGELKNVTDDDIEFVQWGFARFIPDTTQANARIGRLDEPMALIALAQWLNAGFGSTLHQKLSLGIGNTHALGANGLENYLAFSFAGLFNGQPGRNGQTGRPARRLDEIFTFAKEAPAWAQQTATMVSYYHDSETALEESEVNWASRPSYSLGIHTFKDAKEDNVLPWLRHEHRVPICFPDKTMGPDLLFVLRLEDGERIWVAVQSKFTSSDLLDKGVLTEAVKTVTPVNFFKVRVYMRVELDKY
jgi:hypothetical protein